MILTLMMLQAFEPPQPRMQCTPALVARATPRGWSGARMVADGGRLAIGEAATVALVPGKRLAVTLAKPGAASAAVSFVVPHAGRWRVSLDQGAWIDVVRGKAAVESVAHGHGTPCSGVRKRVEFDLTPGRYGLQLSGEAGARVRVMVSRG